MYMGRYLQNMKLNTWYECEKTNNTQRYTKLRSYLFHYSVVWWGLLEKPVFNFLKNSTGIKKWVKQSQKPHTPRDHNSLGRFDLGNIYNGTEILFCHRSHWLLLLLLRRFPCVLPILLDRIHLEDQRLVGNHVVRRHVMVRQGELHLCGGLIWWMFTRTQYIDERDTVNIETTHWYSIYQMKISYIHVYILELICIFVCMYGCMLGDHQEIRKTMTCSDPHLPGIFQFSNDRFQTSGGFYTRQPLQVASQMFLLQNHHSV